MTNDTTTAARRGASWLLLAFGLLAGACSNTHDDGVPSSSGSHWLTCAVDHDCSAKVTGTHCDDHGACVDTSGARVKDPGAGGSSGSHADAGRGGSAGASHAGSGDSGSAGSDSGSGGSHDGAGGSDGGSGGATSGHDAGASGGSGGDGGYQPCAGKSCGDSCSLCAPGDTGCVETAVVKTCDQAGGCSAGHPSCDADAGSSTGTHDCTSLGASDGSSCGGVNGDPIPECCSGTTHLRCVYEACTNSIPGSCHGTFQPVASSTTCGGDPPASCTLGEPKTCGAELTCCAVGRCGPVLSDQGRCEVADPKTGDCMPCACASQPGGCPVCNSPDTPIATPDGDRAVADLREGDLVLSMDHGQLVAVPVLATRNIQVFNHAVVHIVLDNGRTIEISGSHPTADGRRLDALQPGDDLGGPHVQSIELIPYEHDRTYDILPASDTGTYVAGGALIGSTLFVGR